MELELRIHSPFPTPSPEPEVPLHFSDSSLRGFENQRDCLAQSLPAGSFGIQLLPSRFGHAIVLRLPAPFGCLPCGLEPTPALQPVKGGIERALANLERIS